MNNDAVKVTLGQLVNSQSALKKLYDSNLPFAISYKISKIISSIDTELRFFESERAKLFNVYGNSTKDDKIEILPENIEHFESDIQQLLSMEISLHIDLISLSELSEESAVKLTPREVSYINYVIKD